MGNISFDLEALSGAAGKFESAAQRSVEAGTNLGGASISAAAFGSADTGSALASALLAFGGQHSAGAVKIAQAHSAFAARLRTSAALGEQALAQSTQAAAS